MTDRMSVPRVVVAVPARLESARLPGKLLADIAGKPMLQHVLERCRQAKDAIRHFLFLQHQAHPRSVDSGAPALRGCTWLTSTAPLPAPL